MAFDKGFTILAPSAERRGQISLTINDHYLAISKEGARELKLADCDGYVQLATKADKKQTLYAAAATKSDDGAIQLFDVKKNASKKNMSKSNILNVAEVLGLDVDKGTWKIPGTYDKNLNCLVFEGKKARLK